MTVQSFHAVASSVYTSSINLSNRCHNLASYVIALRSNERLAWSGIRLKLERSKSTVAAR